VSTARVLAFRAGVRSPFSPPGVSSPSYGSISGLPSSASSNPRTQPHNRPMLILALGLLLAPQPASQAPNGGTYLYRAALIQAAPGKLLEVVDLWTAGWPG